METQQELTTTEETQTLDQIKGKYFQVLDKGFVGLVDVMGNDLAIEQAARTSYGAGTRKVSDTRNLLRYLMRHKHTTPFEMVVFKFHVRVPMDCWRQWIRHRMSSVNEYSTRYSEAINACQQTSITGWREQSGTNKQGSGGYLSHHEHKVVDGEIIQQGGSLSTDEKWLQEESRRIYEARLKAGVAREQARKDLPLSTYTVAYWKIDLHNLFHFLKLRLDPHAQLEIRLYAQKIASIVREVVPMSWEAFEDYNLNAKNFTSLDMLAMKQLLTFRVTSLEDDVAVKKILKDTGMSDRECAEFYAKFNGQKIEIPKLDLLASQTPEYFEKMIGNE